LVSNDAKDKVLPDAIGNAFFKSNYPFTSGKVKRVFPDWSAHTGVEEEVVGRWYESGWGRKMSPQGPK
jgi:hypothetical protein